MRPLTFLITIVIAFYSTSILCQDIASNNYEIYSSDNYIPSVNYETVVKTNSGENKLSSSSSKSGNTNPVVYDVIQDKYYIFNGQEWIAYNKDNSKDYYSNNLIYLDDGNVRIGEGVAEQQLHVFGNTKISEKLYINTTPGEETGASDYSFLVGGKGIMEELKVNLTTSWPDYVFDSEYELMPINELEAYINKNRHLPGIPSADQVEKDNGFLVGDMQKRMLEKIEELTLYMIDLKKENEEMKKELDELKKKGDKQN